MTPEDDWTPELEAARLELCEFMVEHADDPHTLLVHVDLGRRMKETEQALTILGDIATRLSAAHQPAARAPGMTDAQLRLNDISYVRAVIDWAMNAAETDEDREWTSTAHVALDRLIGAQPAAPACGDVRKQLAGMLYDALWEQRMWGITNRDGSRNPEPPTPQVRSQQLADAILALPPPAPTLDLEAVARLFHDTYERLAPSFGYETRKDTRQFEPTTPNGRLMIAVCGEVARTIIAMAPPADAVCDFVGAYMADPECFKEMDGKMQRVLAGQIAENLGLVLASAQNARPCTCHPDDNPPVPCPRKYALSECRRAASQSAAGTVDLDGLEYGDRLWVRVHVSSVTKGDRDGTVVRSVITDTKDGKLATALWIDDRNVLAYTPQPAGLSALQDIEQRLALAKPYEWSADMMHNFLNGLAKTATEVINAANRAFPTPPAAETEGG